jgi:hypothetical protein
MGGLGGPSGPGGVSFAAEDEPSADFSSAFSEASGIRSSALSWKPRLSVTLKPCSSCSLVIATPTLKAHNATIQPDSGSSKIPAPMGPDEHSHEEKRMQSPACSRQLESRPILYIRHKPDCYCRPSAADCRLYPCPAASPRCKILYKMRARKWAFSPPLSIQRYIS